MFHFAPLSPTRIHLLLEHIKTLKLSLRMIFVKYVFFKIINFKILLKKFQNFKIPKMASLALKGEAVGVAQISAYAGGGGGNGGGGT
jgi:hypothetical protein